MSLINQMLQDLDARRAAHGVGANLPNDVRPLPVVRPSRLPLIIGGVLLALLAGAFVLYQRNGGQRPDAVAPVAVPVVAVTEVAQIPPPVAPVEQKPDTPAAPPVEAPLVKEPSALGLEGSLRMADVINLPVEKTPAAKQSPPLAVPEKTTPTEKKALSGRVMPAVSEPVQAPIPDPTPQQNPGKASKPPVIEKTEPLGTPRDRAEADYRKAIAAANQGRIGDSLDGLRSVLKQDVYHVASRQLLVRLLLEAKRTDEAMQVLQEGLQGQPAQIGWATSLARLQVDRGDLAGAWQTLNYSAPVAANNADYQGFSAHVLQRMGRNRDAAAHYQAAARLSPGDGRWWLGLGLVLEAEGQNNEARDAFLRARQTSNLSAELMTLVEQKLR